MPELVLGPVLRHVDSTDATLWVETDRPCTIEILERQSATFEVCGHHYGIVTVDGLSAGATYPYSVALDGIRKWPPPDGLFPPSVVRTFDPSAALRLMFGSCRVASPPAGEGRVDPAGPDALQQVAAGRRGTPPSTILTLSGDVHHCSLSRRHFAADIGAVSRMYEATCSPLRNPLGRRDRLAMRLVCSRTLAWLTRALARAVGVAALPFNWTRIAGPLFENQIGTVELRGRSAVIRYDRAVHREGSEPRLEPQFEHRLSAADDSIG